MLYTDGKLIVYANLINVLKSTESLESNIHAVH